MNKKALSLVFLTAIISGFSIFINKFGVGFGNSNIFAFLKNLAVALIFIGIIIFLKKLPSIKALKIKEWGKLVLIGLVGGSIPFLLFFKGLSLTSSAQGSLIHKTMFVFVAVLAFYFLKEKISKGFIIGAVFLLIGNALILRNFNFDFSQGDLLILLATIFWAVENVISKKALKNIDSDIVAWGRMFFGSVFICLYLFFIGQFSLLFETRIEQIGWVAVTATLLFLYVLTWYRGLKETPVHVATAILLIGSPITTILNLIYGAQIGTQEIISGLLIIIGIVSILGVSYFTEKIENIFRRKEYGRS